jgi:KDO2-lipid IV(A) lauroyltransferase
MAAEISWQKGRWQRIGDWVAYLVVRVLVCLLQSLSIDTCAVVARHLAWVMNDLFRIRRRVVEENLRAAFPDWNDAQRQALSRRMWEHFLLMLCEIAQAPRKIRHANWRQFISIDGRRELVRLMLDPRPVVAVTGHFGNFEMSGFLAGLLGFPTFTVARPLDNAHLHEFLMSFRESTGQFMLPTKGSAMQAQSIIEHGHTLAILGDHFGGLKGCWVPFFGRPASCHKSVALFAIANQCPLAVITTRRIAGPLQFELSLGDVYDPQYQEPGLGVPELTYWYTQRLEEIIRRTPDQYWWLHRRWKDPRPEKRRGTLSVEPGTENRPQHLRRFDPGGEELHPVTRQATATILPRY